MIKRENTKRVLKSPKAAKDTRHDKLLHRSKKQKKISFSHNTFDMKFFFSKNDYTIRWKFLLFVFKLQYVNALMIHMLVALRFVNKIFSFFFFLKKSQICKKIVPFVNCKKDTWKLYFITIFLLYINLISPFIFQFNCAVWIYFRLRFFFLILIWRK